MKLIVIDTSLDYCSVALLNDDKILLREQLALRRHAQLLLNMFDSVLLEADVLLNQLDAVAFVGGPASFTGIRIAASAAQALAFVNDLPVIRLSTLAVIAQGIFSTQHKNNIIVALDAFMGEIYCGFYQAGGDGLVRALEQDVLIKPDKLILPDGDWAGVGNAWEKYANLIKPAEIFAPKCSAEYGVKLAEKKFNAGNLLTAEQAVPIYLRGKDSWVSMV